MINDINVKKTIIVFLIIVEYVYRNEIIQLKQFAQRNKLFINNVNKSFINNIIDIIIFVKITNIVIKNKNIIIKLNNVVNNKNLKNK